jgi:hypothetical protein
MLRLMLAALLALSLASVVAAQVSPASSQQGGSDCPNRGCKLVSTAEFASGTISDCGTGISFSFGGFTYKPDDGKCIAFIETVPAHTEVDAQTLNPNKYTINGTTFNVMRQQYSCVSCCILGLCSCCKPQGNPTVTNVLFNCQAENCVTPTDNG